MAFLWKCSLLALVLLVLFPQQGSAEAPIGLKLSSFGPNHIKGKYLYTDSLGLQFDIRSGFMEIKTLNGNETIITSYMKLPRNTIYFQIADQGFLSQQENQALVPKAVSKTSKALDEFSRERFSNAEDVWNEDVMLEEALKEALDNLRSMEETRLLEICSKALAQAGASGPRFHMIQPYHLMSLNVLLALDRAGKPVDVIKAPETRVEERPHRSKRCTDLTSDPNNDNCYGMCGKKCNCWEWVCGDCCYHTGCAQHDYCCRKKFWSKYCLLPLGFKFSCSSYGGYNKC